MSKADIKFVERMMAKHYDPRYPDSNRLFDLAFRGAGSATQIRRLRAALKQAAKHICDLRNDTSIEPVDADNKNEWPEYIRAALKGK